MPVLFVLLLAVVLDGSSQTDLAGVNPAVIYGKTHALEGESVVFKCTLPEKSKNKDGSHMYLCKNGIGTRLEVFRVRGEASFTIPNLKVSDMGNYSCVYSKSKFIPNSVTSANKNVPIIHLVVRPWHTAIRTTTSVAEPGKAVQTDNSSLFLLLLLPVLGSVVVVWYYWHTLKTLIYQRCRKKSSVSQSEHGSLSAGPSILARTPNSPISNEEGCRDTVIYVNVKRQPRESEETSQHEEIYQNMRRDSLSSGHENFYNNEPRFSLSSGESMLT